MEVLTLYDCSLPRVRLGDKHDGGYVIFDGITYDGMVSGGIEYTNTFENEFIEKYDVDCYAFDNSIECIPYKNDRIHFEKATINERNNLSPIINKFRSCFVKMDIEGYEWDWLNTLDETTLNNISQLAIEFHFFHNMDGSNEYMRYLNDRLDTLRRLNKTHVLCHLHSNNFSPNFKYNENVLPQVFECTYVNKRIFKNNPHTLLLFKNIRQLPTPFDARNCLKVEDSTAALNYPPFVHEQFQLVKLTD